MPLVFNQVWVNGCFDLLHEGHMHLLRTANEYGEVTVGLNTDDDVKMLKGSTRPVENYSTRERKLLQTGLVKAVLPITTAGLYEVIQTQQPDCLVTGSDHPHATGYDLVRTFVVVPRTEHSTTKAIMDRIPHASQPGSPNGL